MSNTIKITACDNQLILFAINEDASDCFEICNIKSGNYNSVDVVINLTEGTVGQTVTANGVNGPISMPDASFSLPKGKYTLLYSGINWGGPYNFSFSLNGDTPYALSNDSKKPLFGVIWNQGNDSITFEIS